MSNKGILVLGFLISVGVTSAVLADSGHGHDTKAEADAAPGMGMQDGGSKMGMMGGNHHAMMRAMMKMHRASMMGNGMGQMGMMDRDMMAMMMPGVGQDGIGKEMAAKMQEFDTNDDGALTLEEFEDLHMTAMRDRMADRFQHLDADGDGQITQTEIDAAGMRMGAMKNETGGAGMEDHHGDDKE